MRSSVASFVSSLLSFVYYESFLASGRNWSRAIEKFRVLELGAAKFSNLRVFIAIPA